MNKVVRGFTIIEILITLVVMAGLLSLGVAAVGSMQVQARDKERETDIQTIARGLEARYSNGNPVAITTDPLDISLSPGTYPNLNEMYHAFGWSKTQYNPASPGAYLPRLVLGTVSDNFKSPSGINIDAMCVNVSPCSITDMTKVSSQMASNSNDMYIYAPGHADDTICPTGVGTAVASGAEQPCVKYILYWREESTGTIKSLKSERR
jgi:prepilin-type N-terminal cleavage/methylation domain-containing protein